MVCGGKGIDFCDVYGVVTTLKLFPWVAGAKHGWGSWLGCGWEIGGGVEYGGWWFWCDELACSDGVWPSIIGLR
jgi:hypothetical protein